MKLIIEIEPTRKGPHLSSKYDDKGDTTYRPATSADDLKRMASQVIDEWILASAVFPPNESKLSHAASATLPAKAELKVPIGVGSGAWLGHGSEVQLSFPKGNTIIDILFFASAIGKLGLNKVEIECHDPDIKGTLSSCVGFFDLPHRWLPRGRLSIEISPSNLFLLQNPKLCLKQLHDHYAQTENQTT